MARHTFASILVVALAAFSVAALAQTAPPEAKDYAWADACRKCHEPEYEAWAKTKHATALNRLGAAEQEKECIGCHVTGPKQRLLDGSKVVNRGVQCEACHGAAAAHVADPTVKSGLVKKPGSGRCETCHSDKGPHFKGFYYDAMAGLSHKVK